MIKQRWWTTLTGKSWTMNIGDKEACVCMVGDTTSCIAYIFHHNNIPTNLTQVDLDTRLASMVTKLGPYDDVKVAKKACLDEIERVNAQESLAGIKDMEL